MKLCKKTIGLLIEIEKTGAIFWSRKGTKAIVWVRPVLKQNGNHVVAAQWNNARFVQQTFGARGGEIIPDAQSGCLFLEVDLNEKRKTRKKKTVA